MTRSRRRAMTKLSAIIACYRDAPAIPEMYERLTETFRSIGVDYEIIFVNDASPDNAREVLAELASGTRGWCRQPHAELRLPERVHERYPHRHRRRRDPAGRRPAGPARADRRVPREMARGLDVVYGGASRREAPLPMRIAYKAFYRLFRATAYVSVPLDAGDFSLLDRRVIDALNDLPEIRPVHPRPARMGRLPPDRRPVRPAGATVRHVDQLAGRERRVGASSRSLVLLRAARPDHVAGVRHGRPFGRRGIGADRPALRRSVARAEGLHLTYRGDPLPRRDPASVPGHHRLVPRPHLRRGQAPPPVRGRERPQRADRAQPEDDIEADAAGDGRDGPPRRGRHEAPRPVGGRRL